MSVVLVTDGDQRSTLAVARSLGGRGHEVHVTSPSGRSLAGASKFVASDTSVGPASASDYGQRVVAAAHRAGAGSVIPATEASVRALVPLRAELPGQGVPMLDGAAFERVSDKRVVLEAATEVGIRIPRQFVLESPKELERWMPASASGLASGSAEPSASASAFPAWVKPSRSVALPDASGVRGPTPGARRVLDRAALEALVAATPLPAFPLLVQEEVRGNGAGIFLLTDRDEVLAAFAHRRVREKPPSGGVSVCRETGTATPELVEASRALLERLGWRGVAMVEYRIDSRDGTPVLMEVNGRFWGSLQLAVDAGVDFPALLLDHVEGRELPAVTTEWRDVRLRWIWGEVDHVWARFRDGDGAAAVLEVLSITRRDRTEVLRLRDPRPFLRETGSRFGGLMRRLVGAVRRRDRRLPQGPVAASLDHHDVSRRGST